MHTGFCMNLVFFITLENISFLFHPTCFSLEKTLYTYKENIENQINQQFTHKNGLCCILISNKQVWYFDLLKQLIQRSQPHRLPARHKSPVFFSGKRINTKLDFFFSSHTTVAIKVKTNGYTRLLEKVLFIIKQHFMRN